MPKLYGIAKITSSRRQKKEKWMRIRQKVKGLIRWNYVLVYYKEIDGSMGLEGCDTTIGRNFLDGSESEIKKHLCAFFIIASHHSWLFL